MDDENKVVTHTKFFSAETLMRLTRLGMSRRPLSGGFIVLLLGIVLLLALIWFFNGMKYAQEGHLNTFTWEACGGLSMLGVSIVFAVLAGERLTMSAVIILFLTGGVGCFLLFDSMVVSYIQQFL